MERINKKEFLERQRKGLGCKRTKNNWWSMELFKYNSYEKPVKKRHKN